MISTNKKTAKEKTVEKTVFVGKDTPWENPFEVGKDGSVEDTLYKFVNLLRHTPGIEYKIKKELSGKKIICDCNNDFCHAKILEGIAAGSLELKPPQKEKSLGVLFRDFE